VNDITIVSKSIHHSFTINHSPNFQAIHSPKPPILEPLRSTKSYNFNRKKLVGVNPSEKYEFVSWDDDIPNTWKFKTAMFQTTNQNITIEPKK